MFNQVKLPYAYDALEPHIDAETMETHYSKHHASYTKTLNEAVKEAGLEDKSIEEILTGLDAIEDEKLRTKIRNNGGGFYNHNVYFSTMGANAGGEPSGKLAEKIDVAFGSYDKLKEELTSLAKGQFGSGWAWLSVKKDGSLMACNCPNQDNPLIQGKDATPILGIDVWEHAYYLKYKNLRPDYVEAFFNVIDWKAVEKRYEEALA